MTTGDRVRCRKPSSRFSRWREGERGRIVDVVVLPAPWTTHYIVEMDEDGALFSFVADEIEPEHMTTAAAS